MPCDMTEHPEARVADLHVIGTPRVSARARGANGAPWQASREHGPTRTLSLGPPASRTPGVFFFLAHSFSSRVPCVMVNLHPHLGWVWNHLRDTLVVHLKVFSGRLNREWETHSERDSHELGSEAEQNRERRSSTAVLRVSWSSQM